VASVFVHAEVLAAAAAGLGRAGPGNARATDGWRRTASAPPAAAAAAADASTAGAVQQSSSSPSTLHRRRRPQLLEALADSHRRRPCLHRILDDTK